MSAADAARVTRALEGTMVQLDRTRRTLQEFVASMGVPTIGAPPARTPSGPATIPAGPATPSDAVRPVLSGRRTARGRQDPVAVVPEQRPEPSSGMAALAPTALAEHVVDLREAVPRSRERAALRAVESGAWEPVEGPGPYDLAASSAKSMTNAASPAGA